MATATATQLGPKDVCLNDLIEHVECLNEDAPDHTAANAFQRGQHSKSHALKSDADQQLLIKVAFRIPVKLSHLKLVGVDEDSCPSEVLLFANKPHLGFSEAEDGAGAAEQALNLEAGHCNVEESGTGRGENGGDNDKLPDGTLIPLKFVKFQSVSNLSIVVLENCGQEEVTQIQRIGIYGQPVENVTNLSDWKPCKS